MRHIPAGTKAVPSNGGISMFILIVSYQPGLRVPYFTLEKAVFPAQRILINGSEVPVESPGGKFLATYKNTRN